MKYTTKIIEVEAHQWFKNGDHPQDDCFLTDIDTSKRYFSPEIKEGKIVRYYRTPKMDGVISCKHCNKLLEVHGWIDTLEGGHIVCPGDYIITGLKGENYPCKPDIFNMKYEPIDTDERRS